ncbi:MAG: beta-ketoacyl synthase N-terminal-like domain-containing protein [Isosphaeraceae bacterium]
MDTTPDFELMALTPPGEPDPTLAIAASRAGGVGVLNLEFSREPEAGIDALHRLLRYGRGRLGVQVDPEDDALLTAILGAASPGLDFVALTSAVDHRLRETVDRIHGQGKRVIMIATCLEAALAGQASRVDGIIAKGNEAGGWVGEETSFVLLQRLMPRLRVPIFVQGGIGQHTIAACRTAGAAGVVLDSQLLLTRESPLTDQARGRLRTMDGSETVCLGSSFGSGFRCYSRPGLPTVEVLKLQERAALVSEDPAEVLGERWRSAIRGQVDWRDPESSVLAVGQDAAIAASLARRFQTVSDILHAMRESVHEHCATARRARPLAEHSPLARSHGTRFPIVQGPMTRVSDRAPFASSVAEAGGLPFLALALMRGTEVKTLLEETRRQLGERPWGVGILGFVPPELRAEQLEAIRACRPPFALIAGGRPDQSRALESDGVPTYLHVPSPGLLRLFLQEGARRFVFEGRECGGHVGPRTSFVLWESMVEVLLEHLPAGGDPAEFHVLFAGGIHDGLSAAMVSAIAAPLVQLGVRIGVLAGTAYLFTREAVATGAIVPGFQKAALACDRTVLLESGPGHATRCVESPFVFDFAAEKRRLIQEGAAPEDLRHGLEVLNIGRLRVASKGLDHDPRSGRDPAAPRLQSLDNEEQWRRGLYMIGQVAGLRHGLCSIDELHRSISEEGTGRLEMLGDHDRGSVRSGVPQSAVAIVGMACILPGAPDLRTFWSNIVNKVDSITEVPAERWDWRLYFDRDPSAKDKIYSRWGGFIDEVPFDPIAFGMPPSTLKSIEPFQLLALAVVRAALEDAGYLDRPFPRDRTSVILGAGGGGSDLTAGYMVRSCLPLLFGEEAPQLADRLEVKLPTWTEDSFPGLLMNVAAGRVANRFDLGGINCTVDAACASSLAAVYLAVRDLEARTSDVVLVGGVDAIQNPFAFLCFSKTQALSPNGRCRTFDAAADGIAISEGYAAVVMKRLEDAERDGDRIYAVIRGIGGSSDGRDRSMTSPRPEGQVRALARAYEQSGFSASTVGLIEAHGTGTVAGDQAEIQALTSFFTNEGAENQSCAVGSVKSMIGHSKATAGVAGLIKVALALKHRVLPPTIGVTTPNPKANFPASPFYVNTDTRPWINASGSSPRRAGVSAFGFGGTNFHVAVEEYTEEFRGTEETSLQPWPAEVLVWRGRSRADLGEQVRRLLDGLERGARPRLSELAYTMCSQAAQLEAHLPTLSILATSLEHLVDALRRARDLVDGHLARAHDARGLHFAERPLASVGRVAFLFPGQGSQYVNMGRELAVSFDTARSCFERADQLLSSRLGRPLSRWIFPAPVFDQGERKRLERALTETQIAQPALGATELAFLQVLRELDVVPQMLAGHSVGELVALHAAGCFNEETLLGLAECRGRFIKECTTEESGAMAAIAVSPDELLSMPQQMGLTVANFNGPRQTILSGPRSHIEDALNWCAERGIQAQLLPVSCAFHSPLVAAAQQRLAAQLDETPIASPQLPVFSNSSASVYPNEPSRIAELLSTHLVRPVEFTRQVEAMYEAGARIFVEVGPRNVLSGLVGQILGDRSHLCAPLDIAGRPDLVQFLDAIAAMAAEGVSVKFDRLHRGRGPTRLSLDKLASENGQPRHSPTTWLITGGTARPSPRPQQPADSPPPPAAAPRTGKSGQRVATDGRSAFIPVESQVPPTVAARNGHASGPPRTETPPVKSQQIDASSRPGARNGHDFTGKGHGLDTEAPGLAPVTNGGKMARSTAQTPRNSGHTSDRIAAHYKEEPSASPAPEQARLELARQFQQVMMRFLQTQENVMHDLLTYLGSPHGSVSVSTEETVGWHPGSNGNGVGPPYRTDPSAMFVDQPPATLPHERDFSSDQTGFFPREGLGHPEFGPLTPGRPSTDAEPISAKLDVHSRSPGVQPVIETIQQHVEAETSTSPASRETLTARLLAIVSERTGYPEEMLGLDADLEADLGIDSIKRVEIAGTMVRTLDVPKYRTPGIEQLTECRSLRQVVELLYSSLRSSGASNGPEGPVNVARIEAKGEPVPFDDARTRQGIGRFAPNPSTRRDQEDGDSGSRRHGCHPGRRSRRRQEPLRSARGAWHWGDPRDLASRRITGHERSAGLRPRISGPGLRSHRSDPRSPRARRGVDRPDSAWRSPPRRWRWSDPAT